MKIVNVHEAKTILSQLLLEVEHGDDVVIGRNGVPVSRLVPVKPVIAPEPGLWRQYPGWVNFVCDPNLFAAMTDQEMEEEGWLHR